MEPRNTTIPHGVDGHWLDQPGCKECLAEWSFAPYGSLPSDHTPEARREDTKFWLRLLRA